MAQLPQYFSVCEVLSNAKPGSDGTMQALLPAVYKELRALAGSYLKGDAAHTLQPTALVHEALVKMVSDDRRWSGRDHFMAVAARAMRHVLVDYARSKTAAKRGGGASRANIPIEFIASSVGGSSRELRILEMDELLCELAKADERAARGAEMRLFGGMEQEQIARVLGVSRTVVASDWQFARAWLASRVSEKESD